MRASIHALALLACNRGAVASRAYRENRPSAVFLALLDRADEALAQLRAAVQHEQSTLGSESRAAEAHTPHALPTQQAHETGPSVDSFGPTADMPAVQPAEVGTPRPQNGHSVPHERKAAP